MRWPIILPIFLLACKSPTICPEPVVCEIQHQDEVELAKKVSWQSKRLAVLTNAAIKIETEKNACPAVNCHCLPQKVHKHRKRTNALPNLALDE